MRFYLRFAVLLGCLLPLSSHAAYTLHKGKLINSEFVPTLSVQEHYSLMMDALQAQNWEELLKQGLIIFKNFQGTPFAGDSEYYIGLAYFEMKEYQFANEHFSHYLKKQSTPKFFEEAITHKFSIAKQFHRGEKKHLMGWESLPKWIPAKEEAIAIYDEVITALPHHELAAEALFGKAELFLKIEDYKSSVDTYQTLIRRFPKHPLSIESYIEIGRVYLEQSKGEYPDQDFLDLAEINLRKFRQDFPLEPKAKLAEELLNSMKEVYASQLYDIGRFYERTNKKAASQIYYTRILAKYPTTKTAKDADKRLKKMHYTPPKQEIETLE